MKKIKQVIEFILTAVAWLYMIIYWAFMMYGIFCDLTGRPIREFWIYNSSTIHQTEHFFFILFIAILIEILVMLIWKQ